jgi:hypothetical protein
MSASKQKSFWPSSLSTSLLLGTVFLFPLKLFGAEQADTPAQQPDTPVQQPDTPARFPDLLAPIDAQRDYLSEKVISFASRMDRFFGDDRNYQESNKSVFQMDLVRVAGYGGDRKLVLSGRAKLSLPSTEQRLHLLLETDPEKNVTAEPTPGQTVINNQVSAPVSYSLAARYVKELQDTWHFSTDAGLKFPIPIHPFVRTRGSYSVPLDNEWRLKAAESVYWFNNTGVGETTQLDLEHFLSKPVLFRATSTATWLHDKQNIDLRQDLSFYHTVSERTALLYQASAVGVSNPQYQLTEYVVTMLYRYRLHRDWVFLELSPQLHFPKIYDFRSSPTLNMRLEMLFDESK